ncbi:hypothetical protein ACU4GI_21780 [Cupriavidus basilensis]
MTQDLKDPFAEDARKAAPRLAPSSEPSPSLTKGKARRNLHILGLILLAAAVVAWMFWPQSPNSVAGPAPVSKADLPEPEQAGKRLLRDLQEDARAPAAEGRGAPVAMPTPMVNGSAASRALATPDPVVGNSGPSREEEIWGAPIATGATVTLKKTSATEASPPIRWCGR